MPARRRSAVLVTALDVETRAVLRHLKRKGEVTVDGTVFYLGDFEDWSIAVGNAALETPALRLSQSAQLRTLDPAWRFSSGSLAA
jgi:hypothetical protein